MRGWLVLLWVVVTAMAVYFLACERPLPISGPEPFVPGIGECMPIGVTVKCLPPGSYGPEGRGQRFDEKGR